MSSHHFVTEAQSTAIHIVGRNVEQDILNQLLEWNPLIIANEDIYDWLASKNIKIDFLVQSQLGAAPQLPYAYKLWTAKELPQKIHDLITRGGANRLAIVGAEKAVVNEYIKRNEALASTPISVYSGAVKYFSLLKGGIFKKWVAAGYRFAIDAPDGVEITGDLGRSESNYIARSDGWIKVEALIDVIFGEYH